MEAIQIGLAVLIALMVILIFIFSSISVELGFIRNALEKRNEILEEKISLSPINTREYFYCGLVERKEGEQCDKQCGGCEYKEVRNKKNRT